MASNLSLGYFEVGVFFSNYFSSHLGIWDSPLGDSWPPSSSQVCSISITLLPKVSCSILPSSSSSESWINIVSFYGDSKVVCSLGLSSPSKIFLSSSSSCFGLLSCCSIPRLLWALDTSSSSPSSFSSSSSCWGCTSSLCLMPSS